MQERRHRIEKFKELIKEDTKKTLKGIEKATAKRLVLLERFSALNREADAARRLHFQLNKILTRRNALTSSLKAWKELIPSPTPLPESTAAQTDMKLRPTSRLEPVMPSVYAAISLQYPDGTWDPVDANKVLREPSFEEAKARELPDLPTDPICRATVLGALYLQKYGDAPEHVAIARKWLSEKNLYLEVYKGWKEFVVDPALTVAQARKQEETGRRRTRSKAATPDPGPTDRLND